MKSFGPLMRRLRGPLGQSETARRIGLSKGYLANLEAGRKVPTEARARRMLERGFGLTGPALDRTIAELRLLDLGLADPELRALALDLIAGRVPADVLSHLRKLYRRYSGRDSLGPEPD